MTFAYESSMVTAKLKRRYLFIIYLYLLNGLDPI